jgi:squalene-hopene/tetraprenyl-beta-curcumene cyclase
MLNAMLALKTLGYATDHRSTQRQSGISKGLFVDDPEDFRIQPCLSPVWDTAINIIALGESVWTQRSDKVDEPAPDPETRPFAGARGAVAREQGSAAAGRLAAQESAPGGKWWAFEFNNDYYPTPTTR